LRREQRGKGRLARRDLGHVVGYKSVEKAPGVVADDLHHSAVWKKSCLHAKSLGSLAIVSCQKSRRNVSAVISISSLLGHSPGMPDSYDLILKGGTVVNQDGEGLRDIGIRAGLQYMVDE
jgi:hypothetical protein